MQSSMLKAIVEDFGNGGTIDGDLTISGDLTVSGGGSLSFDEILEGTQVIDVTDTEAFLVRKNSDGGDVFLVDTTNSEVDISGKVTITQASASKGLFVDQNANQKGIHVDTVTTSEEGIAIDANSLTTGKGLYVYSNSSSTGTRNLVEIQNDHASATGTTALKIINDSTGNALRIEGQNANIRLQASNDTGSVEFMMYPDIASDNADLRKIKVVDGGTMTFESYRGGSFASDLTIDGATGNVGIGLSTLDTPLDITPRLQVEGLNAST